MYIFPSRYFAKNYVQLGSDGKLIKLTQMLSTKTSDSRKMTVIALNGLFCRSNSMQISSNNAIELGT